MDSMYAQKFITKKYSVIIAIGDRGTSAGRKWRSIGAHEELAGGGTALCFDVNDGVNFAHYMIPLHRTQYCSMLYHNVIVHNAKCG
jgi:hypothetical protein